MCNVYSSDKGVDSAVLSIGRQIVRPECFKCGDIALQGCLDFPMMSILSHKTHLGVVKRNHGPIHRWIFVIACKVYEVRLTKPMHY